MSIIRVALPIPMRQLFDYRCDDVPTTLMGCRVVVPFGPRTMVGVVMETASDSDMADAKLKCAQQVLDAQPVLDEHAMVMAKWLADYYQHPIGDVVSTLLPAALRKGESSAAKDIPFLVLTETGREATAQAFNRARKQQQLWQQLLDGALAMGEVKTRFSAAVIKGLVDKELACIEHRSPEKQFQPGTVNPDAFKPQPNVEQALAITAMNQSLGRFSATLLEGVTGSGKTEVYLQSIEAVLETGKQVLVLVPEIGLTPQTVQRFRQRFMTQVGVLHSGLTDNERLAVWQQAKSGELGLVIGTRSAIFTPLAKPGMIIVDEEHDGSYKQQDGLRYNARDLAVMRAKLQDVPLLLGSATPSLSTLNNALSGRYQHLQLSQRAADAVPPQQHLLDIKNQPIKCGLAPTMISKIAQHLEQQTQVLLFINRRGYAPAMLCHSCGHIESCQRCNSPYTLHKQLNKLQCHHCGGARAIPRQCLACGSHDIAPQGIGTEQLEQGLMQLFPGRSCVRVDSDTTRGKKRLGEMLDAVNAQQHQILIGTQILAKGHHFPNVTLVVILDADGALFSADFRAAEHLAQLITQLSGRAGRADKPGEVWLQTHQPGHPLLQDLINNGYHHFARYALEERKAAHLPPFSHQILLRAEATDQRTPHQFLSEAAALLRKSGVSVVGPLPALMEKRQGRYRAQLLLQSSQRSAVQQCLAAQLGAIEALPVTRKVRWSIDVDPQDFI